MFRSTKRPAHLFPAYGVARNTPRPMVMLFKWAISTVHHIQSVSSGRSSVWHKDTSHSNHSEQHKHKSLFSLYVRRKFQFPNHFDLFNLFQNLLVILPKKINSPKKRSLRAHDWYFTEIYIISMLLLFFCIVQDCWLDLEHRTGNYS